jgi:hypothetical protein
MRRKIARLIIGVVLVIAPYGVADAQAAEKPRMIGWLDQRESGNPYFEAFRLGLRDLGWVEGQAIKVGSPRERPIGCPRSRLSLCV